MGLVRALKFLADNSLQVATLVTDRHNQIAKYMTEVKPEIEHRYDVWHVSKGTSPKLMTAYCLLALIMTGIKKKSARLAKTKECSLIGEWIKSITNHLYWCTATAPDGDDIVKRWKSLVDHLCNKHDDCYHTSLDILEERRKKWFKPGLHHKLFTFYNAN